MNMHTETHKHPPNTAKDSTLHPLLIDSGGSSREKTSWGKHTVSTRSRMKRPQFVRWDSKQNNCVWHFTVAQFHFSVHPFRTDTIYIFTFLLMHLLFFLSFFFKSKKHERLKQPLWIQGLSHTWMRSCIVGGGRIVGGLSIVNQEVISK